MYAVQWNRWRRAIYVELDQPGPTNTVAGNPPVSAFLIAGKGRKLSHKIIMGIESGKKLKTI